MSTDDDRIGYLAGETTSGLDADEQAELDHLNALLADPALWAEPPALLEDTIVAAIAAEASARAVTTTADRDNVVAFERPARRRGRVAYAFAGAVATAAAVLLAIGVIAVATGDGDEGTAIALGPTELAPEAHGTAHVVPQDSGLRIKLDATGLPRRDNGDYYQAWLRNDAGVLVPVGTFHDGNDVTLWAGVALEDFRTLTVTEETVDGDQSSSGRRVLVGSVGS
jgi:hypothetical protein